jgi:hypothetical protein
VSEQIENLQYFVAVGFVEEQLPPALRDLLSSGRPSE